jgi:pimeloyl-ACP methyl ester carboxylesterase
LRAGYDRLGELETLTCPALVLAGERDRHITAASSRETAGRLPNAEFYCYPDTAHLLPWEISDRIRADIDRWLDAHPEVLRP